MGQLTPPSSPSIHFTPIEAETEPKSGDAPDSLPPGDKIGFAVIGLGRLALDQILPAFATSKRCKPVALVSGDAQKAARVAAQYGIPSKNIYSYQTYDRLVENPDVRVIYIVLPNSLHAEYTIRGAKAGKHILCEKPMAVSSGECQQMIAACVQANRKLMIAYRIQYEPHHRAVMQMVRDRKIGTPRMIVADNFQHQGGDLNQWRLKKALAGGGCLPDIGLYCLNTVRFLTGEEPIEITASMYSTPNDPRFAEVEEEVAFQLRFPSGVQASCTSSYNAHETRRYRVVGTEAWLEMDPAFPYQGLRMKEGRRDPANEKAELTIEHVLPAPDQFALEMDHMAQCVTENKKPYTPGEEGLQDQKLMEAIYQSAQSGERVVLPAVAALDFTRGTVPASAS